MVWSDFWCDDSWLGGPQFSQARDGLGSGQWYHYGGCPWTGQVHCWGGRKGCMENAFWAPLKGSWCPAYPCTWMSFHSLTWPYHKKGNYFIWVAWLQYSTIPHQDSQKSERTQKDDDCGWECVAPVLFVALFSPGVSEILTGSVQKYPTLSTFELLMSRILESHSASWLLALEWTFKEGLIGVQAFQVKFAACAQATMWTSKHLSVTLVWWQWTVYVSSANVARNSRNFLC